MTCKALGCKDPRQHGHVMCRRHWFMVPMVIRRRMARNPMSASAAISQDAEAAAIRAVWALENSVEIRWSGRLP